MNSITILSLILALDIPLSQDAAPFPDPPQTLRSKLTLASDEEPGERIIIKGRVYHSDGKTQFAGLILYFYQTDAAGVYNRVNDSWQQPRLYGWLKTDSTGQYAIRTIKPGAYPHGKTPAHIHVTTKYPDGHTKWLKDFLFAGDEFLTQTIIAEAGKAYFSNIVKLTPQPHGPLFGRRDIIVPER